MRRKEQRVRWQVALLIFGIALIGRLFGVFHSTLFAPVVSDSKAFDEMAQNLLAGRGYYSDYEPARSFRAPLYPFFLAGIYAIAGHSYTAVRVVQSVLGAGIAVLIFVIGTRLVNARVGVFAGGGTALYPLLLVLPNGVLTENLYISLLFLVLWFVLMYDRRPMFRLAVLIGFICGLAALTRPIALVFPAFFLVGLLLRNRMPWSAALSTTALLATVLILTVSPWTIRNYFVHHRLIPISTEGSVSFWATNNSLVTPDDQNRTPPEIAQFAEQLLPHNELELERLSWRRGLLFIRDNPMAYLRLTLRRTTLFWESFFPFLKYRIPWIGLLVMAGLGGIVALRMWHMVMWLYIVVAWQYLVYIWIRAEPRYHIPIIPLLILFAAIGVDFLYRQIRRIPAQE